MKKKVFLAGALLTAFAVWTILLRYVDVQAIGPRESSVGFATVNGWFHSLTGVHMSLYTITDWLGLVPVAFGFGFAILGLAYSPIRGPEGNIEYLMYIEKPGEEGPTGGIGPGALQETIRRLVDDSHRELDR